MTAAEVQVSYTEVKHVVHLRLPANLSPMDMDAGWQIRPEQVTLTYSLRSQLDDYRHGWRVHIEVSGPYLPREGLARPGSSRLIPWRDSQMPTWLLELRERHEPTWRPDLPPEIGGRLS